jgi:cyclopropane fatty-acyl-phospholipid synthase-like methyltransferase
MSNSPYSKEFYEGFDKFSLDAARIFLGYLFAVWTPKSVIDVGCGNGTWLAACHENGVKRLVGLEGEWVTQDMMPSPTIELRTTNLRAKFVAEPHDLTISMEVAEHLPPESSDEFFHSLVQLSDAVLFSAAFAGQPGTDHINTRLHSYWAQKFLDSGYLLFDIFRPHFWSDDRVAPWYRQNAFLYVKPTHPLHDALVANSHRAAADARFVDCVHPWLYFLAFDKLQNQSKAAARAMRPPDADAPANTASASRRNEMCPCGSGKRFKHCHGRLA